jgi:Na+/H+ antiporter NhaC
LDAGTSWGLWSLTPLAVTLVLAFATRSALIAMLIGTFVGTLMLGGIPGVGLNELLQGALGNGDFIWIVLIVVLIGVLFEGFREAGVLDVLSDRAAGAGEDTTAGDDARSRRRGRRRVQLATWGMGLLIVDDYFSPLMAGAVMRPMSDRMGIPREKLAYILDATTASVCILVPFTAWGAYLASLIAAQGGPVSGVEEGLAVFIRALPYNFYPILTLLFALLIAAGIVPDFGPMRTAERRARETGAVLRPGANPLLREDLAPSAPRAERRQGSLALELALPITVVIGIFLASLVLSGSVRIVEAFLAGCTVLIVVLSVRGKLRSAADVGGLVMRGAESVVPALLIVALAYALNDVARQLGVGDAVVGLFEAGPGSGALVPLTFLVTAAVSFATGTSWGAFALMMPVSLPAAVSLAGGTLDPLVYQTVAAVAGGGIFGDHASPVSDTTVLASTGAGSDHMDHVITQLPYALAVAGVTLGLYVLL